MVVNTPVLFELNIPYNKTILLPIQKLAVKFGPWEKDKKSYKAIFYLKDLNKVLALTKQKIEFDITDIQVMAAYCPPLSETIPIYGDKGIDSIKITEFPKYFEVIEHRKQENGLIKTLRHEIPRSNVDAVGEIINEIPIGVLRTHKWLAEKVCRKLNIQRFFRENDTFDFQKYFGDRSTIMKLTYWPLKILHAQEIINYHKNGTFERKKDYVIQTTFLTGDKNEHF